MQYPFCLSSTEPTLVLSYTRLQRWHITWFQPSPRCIRLRYCRKETLIPCLLGCQTLLEQYQRDDNVLSLVEAMHDAFDFAHHEDTLKSIKPDTKQAEILTMMLRGVCSCGDFIQSYTTDSQFCMLSSSPLLARVNVAIFREADVEEYGRWSRQRY